jgi:hypothetical protein
MRIVIIAPCRSAVLSTALREQISARSLQTPEVQAGSMERLIERLVAASGNPPVQVIPEETAEAGTIIEKVASAAHGIGGNGRMALNVHQRIERRQGERLTVPVGVEQQFRPVVIIEQARLPRLCLR